LWGLRRLWGEGSGTTIFFFLYSRLQENYRCASCALHFSQLY
jgi:hypothetical protein